MVRIKTVVKNADGTAVCELAVQVVASYTKILI